MLRTEVSAVIITYNPSAVILKNIISNLALFDKVYIVDNSDLDVLLVKNSLHNPKSGVRVLTLGQNLGVATGLNIGISEAEKEGCKWVVTLDQDSVLPIDFIELSSSVAKLYTDIGIISPVHLHNGLPIERNAPETGSIEVLTVMMSGNLLSMKAFKTCGNFLDELFIDYVDTEYCLRLRCAGFKVILSSDISMKHGLGESKWFNFLGFILKPTNHSALRRYYITRNRLYVYRLVMRKDVNFIVLDALMFFKELIFLIAFEKNKLSKIKAVLLGAIDATSGVLGPARRTFK